MQTRFNALAVAVAALCLSTAVQAQNAFNTFGPGQSYMGGEEYVVEGSLSYNGPLWIAMEFTSAASGHLVNVTAPLDIYPPLVTTAKFTLLNDNGGTLGSELETWTAQYQASGPTVFANTVPGLSLTAGTKYWLEMSTTYAEFFGGWHFCDTKQTGPLAYSVDGGKNWAVLQSQPYAAFSVLVTPEPAPFAVLGIGVLPFLCWRMRTRRS